MKIKFNIGYYKYYINLLLPAYIIFTFNLISGCKKVAAPIPLERSSSGKLSRVDLVQSDYDIFPVNGFIASYNDDNLINNLFVKTGQTLQSFSLFYLGTTLSSCIANDNSKQIYSYNTNGSIRTIDYNTLTDTGKVVYKYLNNKLVSVIDSVKKPNKLPILNQYVFIYDRGGNNVDTIKKYTLDLAGVKTLKGYSIFTFDNKINPFTAFPNLRSNANLPGEFPALVNQNNVASIQIVGTTLNASSKGSGLQLDTVTTYRSTLVYQYNSGGNPVKATEKFNDIQFNYTGNRTFIYEY